MNRLPLAAIAAFATAFIAGCPVYSNDQSFRVCTSQGCFACPDHAYSNACVPWTCEGPLDCPSGFACSYGGQCVSSGTTYPTNSAGTCTTPSDCGPRATCGADNQCHSSDCGSGVGCPTGYACALVGGIAQCLSTATGDAGGADASTSDAAVVDTSMEPVESGTLDASDASTDSSEVTTLEAAPGD
jgi:hypothetical protein